MKRKWLFYGIALAYNFSGKHYIVTFSRFEGKETCEVTRISGLIRCPIQCHRTAFEMLKLHFNRCKRCHGSIAVNKVYYISNVRFTSNYSRNF